MASKHRTKIVKAFDHSELLIPSQIARITDLRPEHVSKALRGLEEREIISCETPKVHRGKIFRLTDKGTEIRKAIPNIKI